MTFSMLVKDLRATRNVAIDRIEFVQCRQHPGETFDSFYIRLRRLADCSDLCEHCIDMQITTHIINGIHNAEARKRLLEITPFPTLVQALLVCRSTEITLKNVSLLSDTKNINKISERKISTQAEMCRRCGNFKHKPNETCPAQGVTCHSCGKANHFSSVCRSTRRNNPARFTGNAKIGSIHVLHIATHRRTPTIELEILTNDNKIITSATATPDCGAGNRRHGGARNARLERSDRKQLPDAHEGIGAGVPLLPVPRPGASAL